MKVKIKRTHELAKIPTYAKSGDAGLDLHATSAYTDEDGNLVYGTGLAFEIPEGYVGLLFPRSSNAKQDLLLTNSVGVIDSGFRSEVTMKYAPVGKYRKNTLGLKPSFLYKGLYRVGDRIGQLIIIPYPSIEFEEAEELSETERGHGSYGSSGR